MPGKQFVIMPDGENACFSIKMIPDCDEMTSKCDSQCGVLSTVHCVLMQILGRGGVVKGWSINRPVCCHKHLFVKSTSCYSECLHFLFTITDFEANDHCAFDGTSRGCRRRLLKTLEFLAIFTNAHIKHSIGPWFREWKT